MKERKVFKCSTINIIQKKIVFKVPVMLMQLNPQSKNEMMRKHAGIKSCKNNFMVDI